MGHANAPPASPCINKKTTSLYGLAGVAISPLGIVDVVDYILPNGDIVTSSGTKTPIKMNNGAR